MYKETNKLYKPGDRVRVVSERTQGMNENGAMDEYLDTVVTISKVLKNSYRIKEDEGGWFWWDGDFVGLEADENMSDEMKATALNSILD